MYRSLSSLCSLVDACQYSLLLPPVLGLPLVFSPVTLLLRFTGVPDGLLQGHPPVEVAVISTENLEGRGGEGRGREEGEERRRGEEGEGEGGEGGGGRGREGERERRGREGLRRGGRASGWR